MVEWRDRLLQAPEQWTKVRLPGLARWLLIEQLGDDITKVVTNAADVVPSRIVMQRDGRMFEPEIEAAKDAIDELKRGGVVASDATLSRSRQPLPIRRAAVRNRSAVGGFPIPAGQRDGLARAAGYFGVT